MSFFGLGRTTTVDLSEQALLVVGVIRTVSTKRNVGFHQQKYCILVAASATLLMRFHKQPDDGIQD